MKEHDAPLHDIDFVPYYEDITVDYEPGTTREVTMPDGSHIVLKKLADGLRPDQPRRARSPRSRRRAREQQLLTGLLYVNPETQRRSTRSCAWSTTPLAQLPLDRCGRRSACSTRSWSSSGPARA